MGMDSNDKSEVNPDQIGYQEMIDSNRRNYISQMNIIDSNIARCVRELRESFENLTTKMVIVQDNKNIKSKHKD